MLQIKRNSGIVYIMALAIGILIVTVGVTYLNTMKMDNKIVENQYLRLRRQYNTQAAVNHIVAELKNLGTNSLDSDFGVVYHDIDLDTANDYSYSYTANDHTCVIAIAGDTMYRKSLEVILNDSGFTSAMIAGVDIGYTGSTAAIDGHINGNVRAYNQFEMELFNAADLEIVGTVTQSGMTSGGWVNIPDVIGNGNLTTTFSPYLDGTIYTGNQAFDYSATDEYNRYCNGNWVASNNAVDVTRSGYVIATGSIYLTDNGDNLTLLPDPDNPDFPVLLAGENIYFNVNESDVASGLPGTSPLEDVYIEGLVYARGNIYIQGVTNLHIKGALVARGNIYLNTSVYPITNFTVEYDPRLNPYGFQGGFSGPDHIEVVSWKGHSTD
ncbi:hypothetical protein ACFL3D_02530 [Candidatus Omnitrophota bacterium]